MWRLVQSGEGGPGRIGLVDVDEAEALGDGERDDLAGGLGGALEQRPQPAGQRVVILRRRELEGGVADHVAPGRGIAFDEPVRLERCEQPPGGAAVDAAALGELLRAARRSRGRHRLEQPQRAIDGLDTRGRRGHRGVVVRALSELIVRIVNVDGRGPSAAGAPLYTRELRLATPDRSDSLTSPPAMLSSIGHPVHSPSALFTIRTGGNLHRDWQRGATYGAAPVRRDLGGQGPVALPPRTPGRDRRRRPGREPRGQRRLGVRGERGRQAQARRHVPPRRDRRWREGLHRRPVDHHEAGSGAPHLGLGDAAHATTATTSSARTASPRRRRRTTPSSGRSGSRTASSSTTARRSAPTT